MRLHDFLEYQAREHPTTDFALFEGRRLTYAEADGAANQLANALIGEGLQKGDRIAYLAKNSLEYATMFYGCSKAGVVPVPLNFRLAPAEWAYIINDAGAKRVFVSEEYADGIASIREQLTSVEACIVVGAPRDGFAGFCDWVAAYSTERPERDISPDDELYQMYTSGTTGRPKGAVLLQRAVTAQVHQFQYSMPRQVGDRTLVVAPLYHAAASITLMACVSTGGTAYILEDFHPLHVVDALSKEGIAHATLVPAMIQACLVMVPDVAQRNYDTVVSMAYGASPIAEETLRKAVEVFKCRFYQAFGMTETTAVLTMLSNEDHLRALRGDTHLLLSAGRPLMGTQVKIVDDDDNPVPPGSIGQICGRGPQIMKGYWNLPDASAEALKDGWMHTGDAGRMDEEGFLYVEDRIKDMIISGGENVYPREVENCIFEHAAVADCAVIGIPDEKWGETVRAVICLKAGEQHSEDVFIEHCRARIAHYKCPTTIEFIDALPRNASGKVLKRVLREKFWTGKGRQVS